MKIAYFTDTYLPEINGVTNTLSRLGGYLGQKGIEHMFFAPEYDSEAVTSPEETALRRFPGFKVGVSPNSRLAFPATKPVFGLCDAFAPDLVHVTTEFGMGLRGVKYARSRDIPLITSYHTDYCNYLDYFGLVLLEPFLDAYLRRFHGWAEKTLVPSAHTLRQLSEKGYSNLGVWSRGIDAGRFSPTYKNDMLKARLGIEGRFAFLYVGRLSPEKGLDTLLYAIDKINRGYPGRAAFVFVGDGTFAEEIRQAGFDNAVLTGFLRGEELAEAYASCDCFAFPSGTETFGNTCLEALASGLPVAAVNSGGVTDYLRHGENALLAESGNKDAFVKNLIRVMKDQELRHRLSQNGLATARERDWTSVFDGLLREYEAAIEVRTAAFSRVS